MWQILGNRIYVSIRGGDYEPECREASLSDAGWVHAEYQVPIVCYLVQTDDGKNILIDSGLPEIIPEDERDFVNGQLVFEQLTRIGLQPDDIDMVISTHYDLDHSGNHGAFTKAKYLVQRAHHEHAPGNARFAATRPQWDQPMERIRLVDGDTELLPGF